MNAHTRREAEDRAVNAFARRDFPAFNDALDELAQNVAAETGEGAAADPETELEQMQGAHRRQLDRSRKRIAEVRAKERETVKAIEAEIAALKDRIAQTKRLAAKAVATDRALIAISRQALTMADEVEE